MSEISRFRFAGTALASACKAIFGCLASAAAIAAAAESSGSPPKCAGLSIPGFAECIDTPHGVVLAPTREEADAGAAAARDGETRFSRAVGPVSPYAVLIGTDGDAVQRLADAGYGFMVIPFPNPAARSKGVEESIRRSVEAQVADKGLPPEAVNALVEKALAARKAQQSGRLLTGYTGVAHELGHLWFIRAFWPKLGGKRGEIHYGGPAPDWIDEAVAISMEDEPFTQTRRENFRNLYSGERREALESLATYFHQDHPLKGLAGIVRAERLGGAAPQSGVRVLTQEEVSGQLGVSGAAVQAFYAQGRVVTDFLLEKTGNPMILGKIGKAMAQGKTIEQWLASDGRREKLPANLSDLEKEWRDWLAAHYPTANP